MIWIIRIAENSWHGTFSKWHQNCRQAACSYPQGARLANLVLPHWRSSSNRKDVTGRESVGVITWPTGNTPDGITSWKFNGNRGGTTTIKLQPVRCSGRREIAKNRDLNWERSHSAGHQGSKGLGMTQRVLHYSQENTWEYVWARIPREAVFCVQPGISQSLFPKHSEGKKKKKVLSIWGVKS